MTSLAEIVVMANQTARFPYLSARPVQAAEFRSLNMRRGPLAEMAFPAIIRRPAVTGLAVLGFGDGAVIIRPVCKLVIDRYRLLGMTSITLTGCLLAIMASHAKLHGRIGFELSRPLPAVDHAVMTEVTLDLQLLHMLGMGNNQIPAGRNLSPGHVALKTGLVLDAAIH